MLPNWRLNHSKLMLHSSTDLSGSIRFGSMFIPMSLLWSHSTEHSTPFLLILLASFYSHSHSTPVIVLPFYCILPILVDDHCICAFYLLRSSPMLLIILLPQNGSRMVRRMGVEWSVEWEQYHQYYSYSTEQSTLILLIILLPLYSHSAHDSTPILLMILQGNLV